MAAAPPPAPENLTGDETSYGLTVFSDQAEDILRGSFDPVPLDRSRSSALTVCRKADEAAQAGNYRKALRLIEVCFSLPDAQPHLARLHRVRGKINAAIAKAVADPDKNRPYCAVAAESALRAVTLQPCSVEYSYFRGKLLYGMAKEPNDYAEVIAECERGLAIDDPVDSLEDVMDGSTFMSAGSFVERCRRQLRKLIWNSHLATIKDPEGLIGKANEATQTEEERDESARTGMVHLICSSSGSEAKELGERTESEEVVWNFWNSLSDIERKELLRVKISDVVNYFGPTGAPWLRYHLLIALIWTRTQDESWEYFLCPSPSAPRPRVCSYFFDPEPLRQHALQKHAPQFAKSKKPDRIDDEMAELIIKSSWKPLDREATLKALEDQLERKGEDHHVPAGACLLPTRWIVSNDSKRRQSLEKIHCTFLRLITLGCLAVGHLDELLKFALNELHRLQVQNNTLLDCGMKDLPVCLWCLEETQLLEILKFLEHIDSSCREDNSTQKIGSYLDGLKDMLERLEMKDRILLDDDGVYFILHEGLLLDFPNKQGWKDWYERFLEKLQEGLNVMEMLRNECHGLQILCDRRSELLHDKTALAAQMPNHSEISTVDALILQKDAQIERLSHKFTATTAVDYQTLLIPLVISFVRAKLEYCAMKNAIKKSGTAIEVDFMDMRTDGLLTVKVSDFKAYFGSLKVDFFDEFISRSLEYAGTNETWSLSVCCKCPEKIWDSNSHLDNRQNERAGLPQIINHDLAETIINHCWEPLDVLAAPEILNHSPLDDQYPACVNPPPPIQLTEDSQLKELLKKIHHRFAELIRHGYIAESHLNRVSWFVVDELKRTSSASLFQNCSLDLLPSCICFLGAAQLQKVLNYLDEISHHCGLGIVSDKSCTTLEEVSSIYKCVSGEKVIVLSRDASCLLLRGQVPPSKSNSACQDASSNVFFDRETPCADIISWIFLDSSNWEHYNEHKDRICQSTGIIEMLQKEHNDIHCLCDRRFDLLKYEEALIALESTLELVNQGKMSVLRKRLSKLKKRFYDSMVLNSKSDLDAASSVLKEAEHLNTYLGSYVDNCAGLTWWPPGLASSTEDTCIKHAICMEKHQVSLEIAEVEARILRKVSACDYQSLLLPLVKSFLRARFEGWSKNNSTKKFAAAEPA